MTRFSLGRYLAVALSFAGSAILLFSCEQKISVDDPVNNEELMTEYSENLSIVTSENGLKSYRFESPLVEGYGLARDPYREFRKGIKLTSYESDSTQSISAVLTANYAINYESRRLWEVKGNVVIEKSDGKKLFTSQLFWNQATKKIYSNVDSQIVDGEEVYNCEGFESDESMKEWRYRKLKGVTYVTTPDENTSTDNSAAASADAAP